MGFFANLLGGTLQGVGAGMTAMAADEDKLAAQRALLQERQQAALELQRERAADRQWQREQMARMAQMRPGMASAGSGGADLPRVANGASAVQDAGQDPAQALAIDAGSRAGNWDAVATLADKGLGRPFMTSVAPAAGDFARYDRAGDMQAQPPATALERAAYDVEKGMQGLQIAFARLVGPAAPDAGRAGIDPRGDAGALLSSGGSAPGRPSPLPGGAGGRSAAPSPAMSPAARGDAWRARFGFKG